MKDMIAYWAKLRAIADECTTIRNVSIDQSKRELFTLLAEQLGILGSEVERVITARQTGCNIG